MRRSLRTLRALVVLAEELHFGRAAARIGMAQPHLSGLIAEIEADLGAALFIRRPKVSLTPAGSVITAAAARAVADLDGARREAQRLAHGELGTVRVAFASTVMLTEIPTALNAFRRDRPDVEIVLREMHSAAQHDALEAGVIDLALTREPPSDPGTRGEVLWRDHLVVIGPDGGGADGVAVSDLREEPLVLFRRTIAPALHDQIVAICTDGGFSPNVVQEADEWHTVLALVRCGFGVTIAPSVVAGLALGDLSVQPLSGQAEEVLTYLCWRPATLSPTAAGLAERLLAAA